MSCQIMRCQMPPSESLHRDLVTVWRVFVRFVAGLQQWSQPYKPKCVWLTDEATPLVSLRWLGLSMPQCIFSSIQREYEVWRELRVQCDDCQCDEATLTHTWLWLPGFHWVYWDRETVRKKKGGGPAVLVNSRWCSPGHMSHLSY